MRQFTVRAAKLAAIAGAAALGATTLAYSAIPGSGGTISACYVPESGVLRVLDAEAGETCRASESQLTWSQQGPKGDQGPAGAQGDRGEQGLQGDRGPSDAFVDDPGSVVQIDTRTESRALILHELQLPSGEFVLWAKSTYTNRHNADDRVRCWLYVNSREHDSAGAFVEPGEEASLALMSPLVGPAHVTVNCSAEYGDFWRPRLAAVQVARVNGA